LFRCARPIGSRQLVLECLNLVFDPEHRKGGCRNEDEPEQRAEPDHAPCPRCRPPEWRSPLRGHGGAAVRSAARRRAARARGLRAISAALGFTARRVSNVKLGGGDPAPTGRCREARGALSLRRRKNSLTRRSSSEWKDTTASLPPGASSSSAAASPRSSSSNSSFTAIRKAWKVRVAGSCPGSDCGTTARTI